MPWALHIGKGRVKHAEGRHTFLARLGWAALHSLALEKTCGALAFPYPVGVHWAEEIARGGILQQPQV